MILRYSRSVTALSTTFPSVHVLARQRYRAQRLDPSFIGSAGRRGILTRMRSTATVIGHFNARRSSFLRPTFAVNEFSPMCWYASSTDPQRSLPSIRILFASQGGTAQLFANMLSDALDEKNVPNVTVQSLADDTPENLVTSSLSSSSDSYYLFLTSTSGVGEPPSNGKVFYDWLMSQSNDSFPTDTNSNNRYYALFGLGNSKAHPSHYNVTSKAMDAKLNELKVMTPLMPLALGDDGDCLEDDFDQWQEAIVEQIVSRSTLNGESSTLQDDNSATTNTEDAPHAAEAPTPEPTANSDITVPTESMQCPGAKSGYRRAPIKYPRVLMGPPASSGSNGHAVRRDLLDVAPTFYHERTRAFPVVHNIALNPVASSNGLRELCVSLSAGDDESVQYQAGDHFTVYPRNKDYLVESYLDFVLDDVDPHAAILGNVSSTSTNSKPYPHPIDISLYETLSHAVDLNATPSPSFARFLLDGEDGSMDYKGDIVRHGRTVLDLLLQNSRAGQPKKIALEDLLYQLPPMKARYYSIASSEHTHNRQIYLTYRPVRYVTSRGALREGVATSYLSGLTTGSTVIAVVHANPSFRLPVDPQVSVCMIAGGCGVAPIRAFLEERIQRAPNSNYGPGWLFLGFRDPNDAVYGDMIATALECGALTHAQVMYNNPLGGDGTASSLTVDQQEASRGNVSDAVRRNGAAILAHLQNGGYTYLCGGARTFGVAIENEVHQILQTHGKMSEEEATTYLQRLIHEGRFLEDLSD
jgi:NADPH-ferrihemoprotein reductase